MSIAFHPSHRRDSQGNFATTFTEGRGDDRREVGVVMPEMYGERDPSHNEATLAMAAELSGILLRRTLDFVADGRPDSLPVRLAAVRRHLGHDDRSIATIAEAVGASTGNLHRLIQQFSKLNDSSEVKRSKD